MTDKLTEILAKAWIECDPNRSHRDPDELMAYEEPSELNGKPAWNWFVPRAEALKEYLDKHGLAIVNKAA